MRWLGVMAALALPGAASAQLAERVRATEDGVVRFHYASRPGVEICDRGVRFDERRVVWTGRWDDRAEGCRSGLVELELEVRDGEVRSLELFGRPGDRAPGGEDLGPVAPEEAAAFLHALAVGEAPSRVREDALLPLVLADVTDAWRDLMRLSRDRGAPEAVRKAALFWLGQEAAGAVTEGLRDVALDGGEAQEVRDAAIFALSQRPPDEAISTLMEVARTGEEVETRRKAMFWLAQHQDERVVGFFEEVLLGRIR